MFGLFKRGPIVPVLRLSGAIGVTSPISSGLSLANTESLIEKAFETSGAKAVALQINSPGGSPVQSMLIYKRIRALAAEKEIPVYVFAEDAAASGGYILALAGDEIFAEESSIVGSIGVVSAGFGFDKFIAKHSVDRRIYTAGTRKFALDPFQPENPEDIAHLKTIQADMHNTFIDLVKSRRGSHIDANNESLFTGEFWTGNQANDLGLIDGISDVRTKMRELFGKKVRLKVISKPKGLLSRLRNGASFASDKLLTTAASEAGAGIADQVISKIEERTLWARLGL